VAISIEQREYVAHIVDLLQLIGPVESKSMFGGFGMFLEGLIFGLVAGNELYLKVDTQNLQDYEDLGLQAFSFEKNDRQFKMSYYQAPEEAMEDAELLSDWASNAYCAAMRAAAKKGGKRKKQQIAADSHLVYTLCFINCLSRGTP
jgi:DNA transformation protein